MADRIWCTAYALHTRERALRTALPYRSIYAFEHRMSRWFLEHISCIFREENENARAAENSEESLSEICWGERRTIRYNSHCRFLFMKRRGLQRPNPLHSYGRKFPAISECQARRILSTALNSLGGAHSLLDYLRVVDIVFAQATRRFI